MNLGFLKFWRRLGQSPGRWVLPDDGFDSWMFESNPECLSLLDPQGLLLRMNRHGQASLEIDDPLAVVNQPWHRLWPAQCLLAIDDALAAARAGHIGRFQARSTTAGGNEKWWDVTVTPVREAGRVLRLLAVARDITLIAQAQQLIAQSEDRLVRIVDSTLDAIIAVNEQQDIVVFNAAAARMFGIPVEVALGKPLSIVLPPWSPIGHADFVRSLHALPAGARMGRTVWGQRANGERFPLELTVSQTDVKGVQLYCAVVRDVTDRVAAEAALRDSEESYRLLFEGSLDGILLMDPDGGVLRVNAAAATLLGRPANEICRTGILALQGLGNPLGEALDAVLQARAWSGDFKVHRPGGDVVQLHVAVAPCKDRAGRQQASVMLHDVTERNEAQQRLQLLADQLRQSQKMEALGSIAGGIAHDFNNVIAAILGNAVLTRMNLAPEAPALRYLDEISRAGARARELVRRIMSYSRKEKPVFQRQAIGAVVEEAVGLLRATLPSGIQLSLARRDGEAKVKADATQLHQVLMNLGTNAWQAMPSTSGHVDIVLEREPAGQRVCLTVTDDGAGMDDETRARLFEPFFTTKPAGEGTGLGLSVVHAIVKDHGGEIRVHSVPGQGSRFEIYLPLDDDGPASEEEPGPVVVAAQDAPAHRANAHIVCVDDYDAMVALMTAVFEEQGYRVTGFTSSASALRYLREAGGEVDLLVTDHNMPEVSGVDLAREVRQRHPRLPVIVASGHISRELRENAADAGVTCLFDKPAGIDELCERIAAILLVGEAAATGT